MKEKYRIKIENLINSIQKEIHLDLFEEEYTERYDSTSESYNRDQNINPMNSDYIKSIEKKRTLLGVSKLLPNGRPSDNSSEIYVRKMIYDYLMNKVKNDNLEIKAKHNISSFLKGQ